MGAHAGDVGAIDGDRAEVRHEPGDGVDERRLAGPVRADQPDKFAGTDFEVDVDDGVYATERHRDPASDEQAHDSPTNWGSAGSVSPSRSPTPTLAPAAAAALARLAAARLR